jgi:hypothetical protein
MMQHLAGPTHKKTVERAAAEERRLVQLGNNRWAAENAAVRFTVLCCAIILCHMARSYGSWKQFAQMQLLV